MQLTKTEVKLADIAPEILEAIGDDTRVVVVGTKECPKCDRTIKFLANKGIAAGKYVIEDRFHPVLVALREHLGLDPEAVVALPAVFVDGVYRWHDFNGAAISELGREFKEAANVAA